MKKKLITCLIGSLVALSFGLAFAQPMPPPGHDVGPDRSDYRRNPYRIQHRIDAQQKEIKKGVRAGVLNRNEAAILKDNINQIKRAYSRAKRTDRYVTMEERARLDGMLDRNARMIRRLENNAIRSF